MNFVLLGEQYWQAYFRGNNTGKRTSGGTILASMNWNNTGKICTSGGTIVKYCDNWQA